MSYIDVAKVENMMIRPSSCECVKMDSFFLSKDRFQPSEPIQRSRPEDPPQPPARDQVRVSSPSFPSWKNDSIEGKPCVNGLIQLFLRQRFLLEGDDDKEENEESLEVDYQSVDWSETSQLTEAARGNAVTFSSDNESNFDLSNSRSRTIDKRSSYVDKSTGSLDVDRDLIVSEICDLERSLKTHRPILKSLLPIYDENSRLLGYLKKGTEIKPPSHSHSQSRVHARAPSSSSGGDRTHQSPLISPPSNQTFGVSSARIAVRSAWVPLRIFRQAIKDGGV